MITPYPLEDLRRFTRAEAHATRRAAEALPAFDPAHAIQVLETLLGVAPRVEEQPAWVTWRADREATLGMTPTVAIALLPGTRPLARVVVALDPALAAAVVERALGGEGDGQAPLSDAEQGVLAYVAARALAGSSDEAFRVGGVVSHPEVVARAIGGGPAIAWPLSVSLGTTRGTVTVWVPFESLPLPGAPRAAKSLAGLPVAMAASMGGAKLQRSEVGSLRTGDVVLLDQSTLALGPNGSWEGTVALRAAGGRRTTWQCVVSAGRLTVRSVTRTVEAPSTGGRRRMGDDDTKEVIGDVGDAPVELTVELARFHMPLEDVAQIRVGEVVSTGKPLDARVTLRTGDRAIAHGELVNVDGEVGVRLLSVPGP